MQPFQIQFSCSLSNKTTCQYARDSVISASTRISNSLRIYKQIVVQVALNSFCGSWNNASGTCPRLGLVGQASAASWIPAKLNSLDSEYFQYPQALMKQLNTDINISDADYFNFDINAEFNSDWDFWFSSSGVPISPNQIDFEYVILHELTHGLGFQTGWTQYSSFPTLLSLGAQSDYLAPLPSTNLSNPSSPIKKWQPLNIFDKFLGLPTGEYLSPTYSTPIFDFKPSGMSLQQFITSFQSSSNIQRGKSLFQIVQSSPKSVLFSSAALNISVPLSTSKYIAGTSLIHLDYDTYVDSMDFLMVQYVDRFKGMQLTDIMRKVGLNSSSDAYGPNTLRMMQAMGWPTVIDSSRKSVVVMPFENSKGGGSSTSGGNGKLCGSSIRTIAIVILLNLMLYFNTI